MSNTQDIDEVLTDFSDSEENLNLEKLQIASPEKGGGRREGRKIKQQAEKQQKHLVTSPLPSPTISSHHHHQNQINYDKNEELALLGPLWKDYPLVHKTIPSSYSFCSSSHNQPTTSSFTPSSYYNTTTKTAINPPPLFRNYRSSSMGSIFGGPKPAASSTTSSSTLLSPPKLLDYNNYCTNGLCTSTLVSPSSASRPDSSGSFSPYASCYSGYSGRFNNNNTNGSINGLDIIEPLSRSSSQSSGFISQTGGIHTPPPSSIVNNNNNNNSSNLSSSNSMYGGRGNTINNTNTILPPASSYSSSSVFGGRNMIQHHNTSPIFASQYQQQQPTPPPQDEQQSFVSFSTMTTNRHHRHHHPHHYYSNCNKIYNNNNNNNVPIWSTTATITGSLFKPTNPNNGLNSIMENGNTCSRFASGSNDGSLYLKKLFGIRRTATTTTTATNFCLNKHQYRKTTSSGDDGDLEDTAYSDDDNDNVSFKSAMTSLTVTNLDGRNSSSSSSMRRRNNQKRDIFGFTNTSSSSNNDDGKVVNSSLSFGHYRQQQQQLQGNVPDISSTKSTRSKNSILSGPTLRNLRAKSFLRGNNINNNNENDHTKEDKDKTVTNREKGWISKTYSFIKQLFWRLSLFINIIVMFWIFFGSTYDPHESYVLHHVFHNLTETVIKNTPVVWDSLITNFLEVTSYVLNILLTKDYLLGQGGGVGVEYQNSFNYTNPTVLDFEGIN